MVYNFFFLINILLITNKQTNHVNSLRSYYPNIFTPFGWMQAVFMDRLKKKQKGV